MCGDDDDDDSIFFMYRSPLAAEFHPLFQKRLSASTNSISCGGEGRSDHILPIEMKGWR